MKTPLLIFAAFLIVLTSSAQDWAPVPAGCRMVYGLTDTVITQVVWIESQAGDTVRLNRRIWACDTCRAEIPPNEYSEDASGTVRSAPAYYIDQPHTLGSAWLIEGGLIHLLDFQEVGRELRMPLVAEVGQSWFWNGGSATLESVEVRDFWGEDDSVRVLLLNNGQRVEWSRNHGLIRFWQPRRDNPLRLIGVERESGRQGITVPSFEMIFDYRVGDRFEVEDSYSSGDYWYAEVRKQYTVKEVNAGDEAVTVSWSIRWRSDRYEFPRDPVTNQPDWRKPAEFVSFTVGEYPSQSATFSRSNYQWLGVYPSETAIGPLVERRNGPLNPQQRWAGRLLFNFRKSWNRMIVEVEDDREIGWYTYIQDASLPNRFLSQGFSRETYDRQHFACGMGEIFFQEVRQLPPMEHRRLVAWSRGDTTIGEFSSLSYITSRDNDRAIPLQVALYPNPTRDVLHTANLPDGARLTLTDPLGRVVRQQVAATTIDVSDLPAGLWFIRVEGGNAPQALRFIKE